MVAPMSHTPPEPIRHDWTLEEVEALFALPFSDLMFHAQRVHRAWHDPNAVQLSTLRAINTCNCVRRSGRVPNAVQFSPLLSIKTGACPEDCAYCPQSVHYNTGLERTALLEVAAVRECAQRARSAGATRFCMGAGWRSPRARDLEVVAAMIREVRALGLESCATLGMLTPAQAAQLKAAGLDYYNHNLDTSAEFYGEIISTRTSQQRVT